MLNDQDAIRIADAVKNCFAQIARCEQDLHAIRNSIHSKDAAGTSDKENLEALLEALESGNEVIDAELEKIAPTIEVLSAAPGMSADDILEYLDGITEAYLSRGFERENLSHYLPALLACAQLIDAWLEPTFNVDMDLTATQAQFRDAFDIDGHLQLADGSLLLPRRRQSWRADIDDDADCLGLFARHLRSVTYIPARIDCDDPDTLNCSGQTISAAYQLWSSPVLQAKPMPVDPIIAVAPLAERGSDVTLVPSVCRSKYALRLAYDESRFGEALARAHEQGVHILLVPEMALPEGNQLDFNDRMRQLFLDVEADYYARSGQVSQLRLVVAGVLGGTRPDGHHRNYAAVFDAEGGQPDGFQQLKLSHWNLSRSEQNLFGITYYQAPHGDLSDPIDENSMPAERLTVLEIPGVGRTATLICADMSRNNPGDWLSINAVLDWLYAPIMDKSTCWQISDLTKTARPWIVRRSYRSARLTGTLVITTNSIALSRWVNEANRLAGSSWPPYEKVGIGLVLDGRKNPPRHDHLMVDVDSRDVLELFSRPAADWKPFPH